VSESRVIIVEGRDCAGKSSWIENYRRKLSACGKSSTVLHHGPPPPGAEGWSFYVEPTIRALRERDVVLLDRSLISHLVYTELYEQERMFDDLVAGAMLHQFRLLGARVMYCERSDEDTEITLRERGEEEQIENIQTLGRLYRRVIEDVEQILPVHRVRPVRT